MNLEIVLEENLNQYKIEFATGRPLRRYWKDKYWPKVTQCVIKRNGLIIGLGEVVKHERDIDNPRHGRLFAAKKALKQADDNNKMWRELRNRLLFKILEY